MCLVFWNLEFGIWNLGFGVLVLGCWFWVLGCGVLGLGFLGFRRRALGCWFLSFEFWSLGLAFRAGCSLVMDNEVLAFEHLLLVFDFWLLHVGVCRWCLLVWVCFMDCRF